ncbi:MAG: sulfurtransferase TusA family protein, partial [Alphaproteobacteria bacterium]
MADHFLDITGETCPLTFVKTKLALERARPGDRL